MSSYRDVYPELSQTEFESLIEPLDRHDDVLIGALRAGARETRRTDPSIHWDGIDAWVAAEEEYPFQRYVRHLARSHVGELRWVPLGEVFGPGHRAVWDFIERVEARLAGLVVRALVAGMNRARIDGALIGATSSDRYLDFVDRCCTVGLAEASALRFPLLDPLIERTVRREVRFLAELAMRVKADRRDLAAAFGIEADRPLLSYGVDAGDTHNHGRSVCVLTFGGDDRVVYKPRHVSGEAAFAHLVDDFNDTYGTTIQSLLVLDRGSYGYTGFVEADAQPSQLATFLVDCGELLALLYLLNARDMHFENVLATVDGPVAVDLETLLHPARVYRGHLPVTPGNAPDLVERSVAAIGILPMVLRGQSDGGYIDLGFLGGQVDQRAPFRSLRFEAPFTDEARLRFLPQEVPDRQPLTARYGEAQVKEMGLAMADAFERVLRSVAARRAEWCSMLNRHFSGVRLRYIHNPTVVYERALRLTSSARALHDADYALALLKRMSLHSGDSDRSLVVSEMSQLAERDVPYFTVRADGVEIETGDEEPTGARLDESPLDQTLAKTDQLGPEVIEREADMIRTAFVGRFYDNALALRCAGAGIAEGDRDDPDPGELEACALDIAGRLARSVLPDRFEHLPATWIGPLVSTDPELPWTTGALGYDLYTGRIGPALALVACGQHTGRRDLTDAGSAIFERSARILLDDAYEVRTLRQIGIGAFTGLGGLAWALDAAGRIAGEPAWRDAAGVVVDEIERQCAEVDPATTDLDVISGVAGTLLALRHLDGAAPVARRLLSTITSRIGEGGTSGPGSLWEQSGVSHGITGLLLALAESVNAGLVPPDAVADPAARLLARLDAFHLPDEGRWRSQLHGPHSVTSGWCHGATGIALALDAHNRAFDPDPSVTARLDAAIAAIIDDGFGRNLTWCHGDMGNHDALHVLAADRPELREVADAKARAWLSPRTIALATADRTSRYAYAKSIMVGGAGIVVGLVNRLGPTHRISPTRLAVEHTATLEPAAVGVDREVVTS